MGSPLKEPPTAADLGGFGSRAWIEGLLDPKQIEELKYYGGTAFSHPKTGEKFWEIEGATTECVTTMVTDG